MRRPAAVALLVSLVAGLLSGCWDARAIDQRAFVVAIGIDTAPGERYRVSMQVQRTGFEQRGEKRANTGAKVVVSEGATVRQAVEYARDDLARELDLTFLDLFVLSREVATAHFEDLDWIARTFGMPVSGFVVVAPDEAEPVLRAGAEGHPIPAQFAIFGQMTGGWNRSPAIVAGHMWMVFYRNYFTPLEDIFAPVLSGRGGQLTWEGLAVFRGHRLAGYLSEQHASAFNLVHAGRAERTVTTDVRKGVKATLYLQSVRVKRWVTWEKNGPVLHVAVRGQGDLQELVGLRLQAERDETAVESALSRQLAQEVTGLLKELQRLESDPVGFGELARQAAPYRREVQSGEAWKKVYQAARLDVTASVVMIAPGYMK